MAITENGLLQRRGDAGEVLRLAGGALSGLETQARRNNERLDWRSVSEHRIDARISLMLEPKFDHQRDCSHAQVIDTFDGMASGQPAEPDGAFQAVRRASWKLDNRGAHAALKGGGLYAHCLAWGE